MSIEITSLSHDGKGVARMGGKVAFIAGALPGETVHAELHQRHRHYDDYRLIEVLSTAPDRTVPQCPLVGRCGGCDLQHLAASAQLVHKQRTVLSLLQRQAGLEPKQLELPLVSAPYHYRRRARLAVAVPRRGGRPLVGFREGSGTRVVSVDHCPVLAAQLAPLPGLLEQALASLQRPADLGHVELSLSESWGGQSYPVMLVRSIAPLSAHDVSVLTDFAASQSAYLALRAAEAPLSYAHNPMPEAPGYLLPEFDLRMEYQPGDFLQGNAEVNRLLVGRLADWLGDHAESRLLDAFSGLGNFGLPLARRGYQVVGLEVAPAMVERARHNALTNGLENAEFRVRDLMADVPASVTKGFDTVVLDPPRIGARLLVGELAARRVPRILYVSCAPATLARDAAVLAQAGYRLARLCLVDMFPQTSHIETAALFQWAGRKRR